MTLYITDKFSIAMFETFNHELMIEHVSMKKLKYLLKKYKNKIIINLNSNKKAKTLNIKAIETEMSIKKGDVIYVITSDFGRKNSGNKLYQKYSCKKISIIE